MKTFYILLAFGILTSCKNSNNELLLKTQKEYVKELNHKEKLLFKYISNKFYSSDTRIDSVQKLKELNASFKNLIKQINKENISKYKSKKNNFLTIYRDRRRFKDYPKDSIQSQILSKNKIDTNIFKINLLQTHIKLLNYYVKTNTRMSSCGFEKAEIKIIAKTKEFEEICRNSFFENGKLFLYLGKNHFSFNKIYFGKFKSDTLIAEMIDKNDYYNIENESELKMDVYETFEGDYLSKDFYFDLSKLNKDLYKNNKLEGMINIPSPRGGYDIYPFSFTFKE